MLHNMLRFVMCIAIAVPFGVLAAEKPAPERKASPEQLISSMDDAEQSYYFQAFDYSMEVVKPGEKYDWKSYDSSGYIEVDKPFVRNNTICRNFREYISNRKLYSMSSEGVGCKRMGRAGWCKLRKGDLQTCALEPPENSLEALMRDASERATRGNTAVDSTVYHWWPF